MKKNVELKITSTQYVENLKPSGETFLRELEKEDSIEIHTEGTLYSKGKAMYISYNESKEAGLENMRTLVKLNEGALSIRRFGKEDKGLDMDMELRPGIRNITRYKAPMVPLVELELYTNSLDEDLDEDGYGKISVDYRIKLDQIFIRRNILEIEVKPSLS
ncbi:MAG TPA: DUF1934 domain-containing protein [Mogibacterium sp.]|nr:DUF1934 domain-containing protein [Mogibacterium sp.]